MQFHDQDTVVTAIMTIENNAFLVSSGEDRKLNLVQLSSNSLEFTENVDRTYVNSIQRF